jgi:predicted O-linked N-acetylglucosamine transferase (SPINDLY family)
MSIEFLSHCISAAHAANASRQYDVAVGWCQKALQLAPNLPEAWFNLGLAFTGQSQVQKAIEALLKAAALAPGHADAQNSVSLHLIELGAHTEAMRCLERALTLAPDFAFAHYNLGGLLTKLHRPVEAAAAFQKAIELEPTLTDAYYHLGNALLDLKQPKAALEAFEQALVLKPDYKYLPGHILNIKRQMGWWQDDAQSLDEIVRKIGQGELACAPFVFLGLVDSPSQQRRVAELAVEADYREKPDLGPIPRRARQEKIRIGYYSTDFHNHATAYLMAGLIELHDREKFELIGLSFGPDRQDEMRQRLVAGFDRFIDVRSHTDSAVAQLSRDLEIDIAVDLKGHTLGARPGIFSYRAAPLQVNYLGYPGTMGTNYFDYILADHTVIPSGAEGGYLEKVAYLPHSYQANDASRRIADKVFSREELGLPLTGFVFCCFNNNYKITPDVFSSWMRMLRRLDKAVLWLLADNPEVELNLRNEAQRRDVDPDRLVFARRLPLAEHLARHRVADLFLDTLPCNAHTTASDALWAGLPTLTQIGQSFASRVAASLLEAIGLPELITHTSEEYEALAVGLATNPDQLAAIKEKLAQNRRATPLFDTLSFVRHIEAAYRTIYERYQADLPPEHINIQPL